VRTVEMFVRRTVSVLVLVSRSDARYYRFRSCRNSDADDAETFSGPVSTLPACILPELHAVKVLFYAESVVVVTSGHVTKMEAKPFDPPLSKTPCYTQTAQLCLL